TMQRYQKAKEDLLGLRREYELDMDNCQVEFTGDGITMSDGDDPTERTSQSILVGTINHVNARLKEVGRALVRWEDGVYGLCVECGKCIAQSRLKANPLAERCLKCQIAVENKRNRTRWEEPSLASLGSRTVTKAKQANVKRIESFDGVR
ncbi:MAG: TraR/DksA C4-type zinc finger protein, partial [Planctomycetota bacterium]